MDGLRTLLVSIGGWAKQRPAVAMALLLPVAVIVGAAGMKASMTAPPAAKGEAKQDRPAPDAKSVGDHVNAAAVTVATQTLKMVEEAMAAGGARSRGEALCVLAGDGNLEAVKYLLDQGEDVNARDRNGCTPLMKAAYSRSKEVVEFLLRQPQIELQLVDDNGDNAFVHAASQNDNWPLAMRLKTAGGSWPTLHQGEINPIKERDPEAITDKDVLDIDKLFITLGKEPACHLAACVPSSLHNLWRAFDKIDLGWHVNEPELRQAAVAEYWKGAVLYLNRVIGTTSRAQLLYSEHAWRAVELPADVVSDIRSLRQEHPEAMAGEVRDSKLCARIRNINGRLMDFTLSPYLRVRLDGGSRSAAWSQPLPSGSLPSTAPAFVTDWISDGSLKGKTLAQIQDMIDELLASAGQRFSDAARNAKYNAKGYSQVFENPPLNNVQKNNLQVLTDKRSKLREAAKAGAKTP